MSPSWVTFVFEAANFLLLAALLGWLFFRPVRRALETRRAGLEAEEKGAAEKLAEAERLRSEAAARRKELEGSLSSLRARIREDAERERSKLLEAARAQADEERSHARAELLAQRRAQAARLAGDAAAAARELVVRLLERIDGPDLEHALVASATRELQKLASGGPLAPVIVESAAALDASSLAAIAEAAGLAPSDLSVREDPGLTAGVRVLTSRGLVDASAAGLSTYAERALQSRLAEEGAFADV